MEEFIYIKDTIKKIKQNEISKTTFAEKIEISLINIYQAITMIHFKIFKHNKIKDTIYSNEIFTKEDMNTFKFLHNFKHHTVHENRKMSDRFQKYNIISKLIPSPNYQRNKRKQKEHINLITSIKFLFQKFEKINNDI
jgi:hypothetical protein